MKIYELKMKFLSPAFLGNAEQKGQWRTPPLKALLRQWWRVAYATDKNFEVNLNEMRDQEGLLFGNAWLENRFCKSKIRIRLDRWDEGKLQTWQQLDNVKHPEVSRGVISSDLYLGYGPLSLVNNKVKIKNKAAIQADESATLCLAIPDEDSSLIARSLWLMDQFGTLGSRSRNGWGSFSFEQHDEALNRMLSGQSLPLRNWRDCLALDWPHAIGRDDKGALTWNINIDGHSDSDWKSLMKRMAEIKIGLRTQFKFASGKNAQSPEARHWLSYPVTNHSVVPWERKAARLPNSLRFKLRRTPENKLVGVIFHMPCIPPAAFSPEKKVIEIEDVWSQVHAFLDKNLPRS